MNKENAKRWRVAMFAIVLFMSLLAGAKQGNGTGGLMLAGIVCLLALPYLISDWVLPRIKAKRTPSRPGPAPEGALQLWLAPLEGQFYCTRVEWAGYSHDGSGDYYALVTKPC